MNKREQEVRNILAMRGAADLMAEHDAAMELANRVRQHAERITGAGSASTVPPTLLEELKSAASILAGVPSYAPPPREGQREGGGSNG